MEVAMSPSRDLSLAWLFVLGAAITAAAQPTPPRYHASHGTTLNVFGGVASGGSDSGGLFGGAVGWEFTPWFGIEGDAAWLDRRGANEDFAATASLHVNLTGRRTAVPFLKGGIGLYHARFANEAGVGPEFYRRRLGNVQSTIGRSLTFTDPAIVAGGGVNLFLSRHVAVRPQVEAIMAVRGSRTHVVTAFTMHLAYHFEDHPITSSRTRR
jgi:hypothetical protein